MVSAGGDLQAALDQAQPGDIIELEAGATFTGSFTLRNKTGAGGSNIRPAAGVQLPLRVDTTLFHLNSTISKGS